MKQYPAAFLSLLFYGAIRCASFAETVSDPVESGAGWQEINGGWFSSADGGLTPVAGDSFWTAVNAGGNVRGTYQLFKYPVESGTVNVEYSIGNRTDFALSNAQGLLFADSNRDAAFSWDERIVPAETSRPEPKPGQWAQWKDTYYITDESRTAGGDLVSGLPFGFVFSGAVEKGEGASFDALHIETAAGCAGRKETVRTVDAPANSWRFITLADWHWAEKYVNADKDWAPELIAEDIAAVSMLRRNYGGDLILLPGDSNGGHWDRPGFIKNFQPGLSPEQAILKAGNLCYTGMIDSFRKGGYDKLLMAVGDHEVGDNPWPVDSAVSRCQPQFREAFSKAWNTDPDGGRFRYDQPIGSAPSRPLGTPFEETSYAYQHQNALFVTVDVFYQESPSKEIGEEGTVTGAVTGEHLEWLDAVLTEARRDDSIKHIFVQAHLPVIYPVRKVSSSGMLMDDGENSAFWQTLRKHNVDIYFAGEVHANTVTKDSQSDLLQVVSRGNFFDNFLTVDVTDEQIDIMLYDQTDEKASDGQYSVIGTLRIDKSGKQKQIEATGDLALLNPSDRMFHFDFEEQLPLAEHPIPNMPAWRKNEIDVRGIHCDTVIPNRGALGPQYNALAANIALDSGPFGSAGHFAEKSRMASWAMGPFQAGHALSFSLWIKTDSTAHSVLINTASIWKEGKGFFNLNLNGGVPEVVISKDDALTAPNVFLNDGQWHHLAAVMPHDNCRLSDVRLFADGKELKTKLRGADAPVYLDQAIRVSFGSLAYSSSGYDVLNVSPYRGLLDEISIWARPLTDAEAAADHAGRQ